jgi:hypothetical protein
MFLAEIIASGQESGMDADVIADLDQATDKTTQPIRVLHVEDDPTIAGLRLPSPVGLALRKVTGVVGLN